MDKENKVGLLRPDLLKNAMNIIEMVMQIAPEIGKLEVHDNFQAVKKVIRGYIDIEEAIREEKKKMFCQAFIEMGAWK